MAMIDAAAAGMLVRVVIGGNCIGAVNAARESPWPAVHDVKPGWVGERV